MAIAEPSPDCGLCPRLVDYRLENQTKYPNYHNAPVDSFGPTDARLLIVGLAPGVHGANQTARPFTGDYAGDLLYATLNKFDFSNGEYQSRPDDGVELVDCMITNAVRCVPPQNKPVGAEIKTCRQFLVSLIENMPNLRAIMALGRIAHESTISTLGLRQKEFKFAHQASHPLEPLSSENRATRLFDSYHCSRYNTNTNRLTPEMFEAVFQDIRAFLDKA